jgi:hypothetical protein
VCEANVWCLKASLYYPAGSYEAVQIDTPGDRILNEDGTLQQVLAYRNGKLADPKLAEKETKLLDDLERNKGKIEIPDLNGNIIK